MTGGINEIEDLIVAEARKQSLQPNAAAMKQVALDLAGSEVVGGTIMIAGKGALHPRDYVRSLQASMPNGFKPVAMNPIATGNLNLTEQMRRKIAEKRSRVMPSDWDEVRKRATGKTAAMMDLARAQRMAQ